jgi:hypothetical protein
MKRQVHVAVSGSRFTVGDEGAGFQRASRERSEQLTQSEQFNTAKATSGSPTRTAS